MRHSCCTSCFSVREAHDVAKLAQSKLIVFSRTIKRVQLNFWLILSLRQTICCVPLERKLYFCSTNISIAVFRIRDFETVSSFLKLENKLENWKIKQKESKSNVPSVFAECFHKVPTWPGIPHFFQLSNQNISRMEKFSYNSRKRNICLLLTTVFVPRANNQNPTHMKWDSVQLVPPLSKLSKRKSDILLKTYTLYTTGQIIKCDLFLFTHFCGNKSYKKAFTNWNIYFNSDLWTQYLLMGYSREK